MTDPPLYDLCLTARWGERRVPMVNDRDLPPASMLMNIALTMRWSGYPAIADKLKILAAEAFSTPPEEKKKP